MKNIATSPGFTVCVGQEKNAPFSREDRRWGWGNTGCSSFLNG